MLNVGRIGFLGGGKIAQSMAKGFIAAGLTKAEAIIASVHPSDTASLESFKKLGAETIVENIPVVEKSDIIFISVKPLVVPEVLQSIKSHSDGKLFISVALGITLSKLKENLEKCARIIRAMPNTPSIVQQGCTVFARGANVTDGDIKNTEALFKAIGTSEEVDEKFMDVCTALSGSGPAYIFVLIEALADGAVNMGLPRDVAYRLASQTVLGAAQLVRDTKKHPGQLKDDVTSPAGSTAAGLNHLEKTGYRTSIAGAIEAATKRCKEISASLH